MFRLLFNLLICWLQCVVAVRSTPLAIINAALAILYRRCCTIPGLGPEELPGGVYARSTCVDYRPLSILPVFC